MFHRLHAAARALLVYTVLVILWGAYVRVSGSGAGCADHWPLCNGEFVPRPDRIETLIEFAHRVTSGLAGLFAVGIFFWARRLTPAGHALRRASAWALAFMLLEGAVGAALVKLALVEDDASVLRAVVIGLHLANTFGLLAAQVWTVHAASGREPVRLHDLGRFPALWAAGGLLVLVGASGAVTALGDTLFPASSLAEGVAQDLSAGAHFLVRLRVVHPILALGSAAFVVYAALALRARSADGPLRERAAWLVGLTFAQVLAGFVNLWLLAPASMQMVHLLLADAVWIALVYLWLRAFSTGSLAAEAP